MNIDANADTNADGHRYRSAIHRSPRQPLLAIRSSLTESSGPLFGHAHVQPGDADLLLNHAAVGRTAIGERMIIGGRVLEQDGRALDGVLIELWQANAGGRYRHRSDDYLAELDPNFGGCGRCITDAHGNYAFRTVRPGPYPWPNGPNAWRPSHLHFSVFGRGFAQRLVTQAYFEGDPLIRQCAIVATLGHEAAVKRLTARLDLPGSQPFDLLRYRFDIVLRGRDATPLLP